MIDVKQLCYNMPKEFIIIMEYVRTMHYTTEVDYHFIEQNFQSLLHSYQHDNDGVFDWHI